METTAFGSKAYKSFTVDEARVHVPRVLANHLVGRFDVGRRNVIGAEQLPVEIGVLVADGGIGIISQRLMVANGETDFFRDVGLEELRAPPAVIGANDFLHHVVKQARKNDFFRHAVLHRQVRALQDVVGRVHESQFEEIVECGIGRHRRKSSYIFRRCAGRYKKPTPSRYFRVSICASTSATVGYYFGPRRDRPFWPFNSAIMCDSRASARASESMRFTASGPPRLSRNAFRSISMSPS